MPIFPVWFNDGSIPKPDKKTFYEIASNGIFIHKENPFWKAIVPVERLSILEEGRPALEVFLPPIPAEITQTIARFFAWVSRTMNTEAMVLLWWNTEQNTYSISVPDQVVESDGIQYKNHSNPGCQLIGSVHSHGTYPAGHSGIDHRDEKFFDGIHGTFGRFSSREEFEISLQASINNSRFFLNPTDLFEGIKSSRLIKSNLDMGNVREKSPAVIETLQGGKWFSKAKDSNPYPRWYSVEGGLIIKDYKPPAEWISKVKKAPLVEIPGFRKGGIK